MGTITRHRDATDLRGLRFARIVNHRATDDGGDYLVEVIASSDEPVDMGRVREVLVHDAAAVDVTAAKSVLFNHDRSLPIGGIVSLRFDGGKLLATLRIDGRARTAMGVPIADLIRRGEIEGISIGYHYRDDAIAFDAETGIVTVSRWILREISVTPTQADLTAKITARAQALAMTVGASSKVDLARERIRADRAEIRAAVWSEALRHGIDMAGIEVDEEFLSRFADLPSVSAWAEDLAARQAPIHQPAVVIHDQRDKASEAAEGFLLHRSGLANARSNDGNPLLGRDYVGAARRWAELVGIENTGDWSREDLAWLILGRPENLSERAQRGAASVLSEHFSSFVTLDAVTKVVARGFEQSAATVTYPRWTARNSVKDFKEFKLGTLTTDNLQEVAESQEFPELVKSEGVFADAVKMWGGTISLTLQTIINDDAREFDRALRQAGAIAQKTIEHRAYQRLLRGLTPDTDAATWTDNTTVGALSYATTDEAVAARANLDAVAGAMAAKLGLDNRPTGVAPRLLLAAPTLAGQARGVASGRVAPGQITLHLPATGPLEVLTSAWLSTGSGLTGAANGTYYVLADPDQTPAVLLSEVQGFERVQVNPIDKGPVAARGWRIWKPFEVSVVSIANRDGTEIIAGAHRGTAS